MKLLGFKQPNQLEASLESDTLEINFFVENLSTAIATQVVLVEKSPKLKKGLVNPTHARLECLYFELGGRGENIRLGLMELESEEDLPKVLEAKTEMLKFVVSHLHNPDLIAAALAKRHGGRSPWIINLQTQTKF